MIDKAKATEVFGDIEKVLNDTNIIVRIKGSSMWPFFKEETTKVELKKIENFKKGRIYLFINNNTYVLHRLIKINGDTLTFRGDGNVAVEVVDKSAVIASLEGFSNNCKETHISNKWYRFKVFIYRLLPRRVMLKVFKRKR